MQTLSVIVTCYGKENELVEKTINDLLSAKKINSSIDLIFAYKNSDKFNYDWVQTKFASHFKKIININNPNGKKLAKFKAGLEYANSKYVLPFDADDLVMLDEVNQLIDFLKNNTADVIVTRTTFANDSDTNNVFSYERPIMSKPKNHGYFNWNTIYSIDMAKIVSEHSNDEVLFGLDQGFCWYSVFYSKKIINCWYSFTKYIKYEGSTSSKKARASDNAIKSIIIMMNEFNLNINNIVNINYKKYLLKLIYSEYLNLFDKYITNGKKEIYRMIIESIKKSTHLNIYKKSFLLFIFKSVKNIPFLRKIIAYFQ